MWCTLLLFPLGSTSSQLSNTIHSCEDQVGLFEEARIRYSRGERIVGVVQLEAIGLDSDLQMQLEAALSGPRQLILPAGMKVGLPAGSAAQVTEAANALVRPLLPLDPPRQSRPCGTCGGAGVGEFACSGPESCADCRGTGQLPPAVAVELGR